LNDLQAWFLEDFEGYPTMIFEGYTRMVFGEFDWEYLRGFRNYFRDICEVYADTQWVSK
jgi:hypothetical protein